MSTTIILLVLAASLMGADVTKWVIPRCDVMHLAEQDAIPVQKLGLQTGTDSEKSVPLSSRGVTS